MHDGASKTAIEKPQSSKNQLQNSYEHTTLQEKISYLIYEK